MSLSSIRRVALPFLFASLAVSASAYAKEPPAMIYLKTKCALCHGADGRGDTPAGKQSGVRSFALPEVQSQTDEQLSAIIADGKGKMPGFKARLSPDDVSLMVKYVRDLASKQ